MRARWLKLVVVGAVFAGVLVVARVAPATAVDPVTYTKTYTGADFESLDVRIFRQFVSGSGGGVYPEFHNDGSNLIPDVYLEARLDLPVGAALTSVTFYYRDCGYFPIGPPGYPLATLYIGYYRPSNGSFQYVRPETPGEWGDCAQRYAFTRNGQPILTATAGRRYTIGAHVTSEAVELRTPPPTNVSWYLAGATIKYTCAADCF